MLCSLRRSRIETMSLERPMESTRRKSLEFPEIPVETTASHASAPRKLRTWAGTLSFSEELSQTAPKCHGFAYIAHGAHKNNISA